MPVMMDSEKVKYQDVYFTNTYLTRQNFYVQRLSVFFIYACYQFDSESAAGDYDFQITYSETLNNEYIGRIYQMSS